MNCGVVLFLISTIGAIYLGFLMRRPVSLLCDSSKCPYCYGTDLCADVFNERITLSYETFGDLFNNLVGTKNVYFADYSGTRVVLKKLGNEQELESVSPLYPISKDQILHHINLGSSTKGLKSCDFRTSELLIERLQDRFTLEQVWTIIQINVEPLVLSIFPNGKHWPVPLVHGACGFVLVEKHCGRPLDYYRTFDWPRRAFFALQLLEAAINFTLRHKDFRLYLTDISPDNIAVDDDFNLYFIDVENVIVKQKLPSDNGTVHYSRHFDDEGYVYSEDEVCEHDISDHNIYAVCKLLLSKKAPWPMMHEGLLHTPPYEVHDSPLFALVEDCVDSAEKTSRFHIAQELIKLLSEIVI